MSSIIKFKALSGAYEDGPLCYMLQIDEYKFLLDCGWNEKCSVEILEKYKQNIKSVDAILLSYPDLNHLGALPYLISKMNLKCQIYCTVPVFKMGQMFLYDFILSKTQNENFDTYNLDDIDNTFDKIQQIKYSQTINLKGKGQGLQITALPGGHMIGGTIWKILKDGEEEIIYAVDYNHHKERHLNGCVLDAISKPTLLITDAYNFLYNQEKRKTRDEKLLEKILNTLRNDGNIMICTDTGGRVLELAYFLDQLWKNENSGLFSYSIVLLSNVSVSVIEFAKSQVEWMNDKIVQSFEVGRYNPFDFKYIKLCTSLNELNYLNGPSRNKLVLVSLSDLECGHAKNLFVDWCSDPKNTILFTNRAAANTLAAKLMEEPKLRKVTIDYNRRVNLDGEELEEYYREQEEREREEKERLKKSKELESIDESSSSEDEESGLNIVSSIPAGNHDLMKLQENKNQFFKHKTKRFPMFPYKEELIKWDDYGEEIRKDEFAYLIEINPYEQRIIETNDIEMPEDDAIEQEEIPTKCIKETLTLDIRCKIVYIDYEGRSDGESIKKILSNVKPKNLVLIHGSEKSTKEMRDFCQKQQIVQEGRIFTPKIGEIVNATFETQIYNVKLKDELVSSLKFQKIKDYELAWVDAVIKSGNLQETEFETGQKPEGSVEYGFSLHPLPKNSEEKHKTVFVNEPKLSDLKQIFSQNSIQAEFHGGVLVCNGIVALKKNQSGRIILEGVVSEDYYKVRKILYEQYAML
ncbi:unnamed protein product [Brachionus calyciflorus]|uniref:Cleavage and polyadenylation specificity factor subunit 2 n=1 Tax=Brachionus calyciflorus TaxID=104777 RepID=A0A814KLC0_9BILA|nr:unnamed protein product [Brachionus calyciflorus]